MNARSVSLEQMLAGLKESWNQHDMAHYASHFDLDAEYVNAIGMQWVGHPEIERGHTRMHQAVFRNSRITAMKNRVRHLSPDLAFVVSEWEMVGAQPPEGWGMSEPRRGVLSLICSRSNGGWQIVFGQNTEIQPIQIPRE